MVNKKTITSSKVLVHVREPLKNEIWFGINIAFEIIVGEMEDASIQRMMSNPHLRSGNKTPSE